MPSHRKGKASSIPCAWTPHKYRRGKSPWIKYQKPGGRGGNYRRRCMRMASFLCELEKREVRVCATHMGELIRQGWNAFPISFGQDNLVATAKNQKFDYVTGRKPGWGMPQLDSWIKPEGFNHQFCIELTPTLKILQRYNEPIVYWLPLTCPSCVNTIWTDISLMKLSPSKFIKAINSIIKEPSNLWVLTRSGKSRSLLKITPRL